MTKPRNEQAKSLDPRLLRSSFSAADKIGQIRREERIISVLHKKITDPETVKKSKGDKVMSTDRKGNYKSDYISIGDLEQLIAGKNLIDLYDLLATLSETPTGAPTHKVPLTDGSTISIRPRITAGGQMLEYGIDSSGLNYREVMLLNSLVFDVVEEMYIEASTREFAAGRMLDETDKNRNYLAIIELFKDMGKIQIGMKEPGSFKTSEAFAQQLLAKKQEYEANKPVIELLESLVKLQADYEKAGRKTHKADIEKLLNAAYKIYEDKAIDPEQKMQGIMSLVNAAYENQRQHFASLRGKKGEATFDDRVASSKDFQFPQKLKGLMENPAYKPYLPTPKPPATPSERLHKTMLAKANNPKFYENFLKTMSTSIQTFNGAKKLPKAIQEIYLQLKRYEEGKELPRAACFNIFKLLDKELNQKPSLFHKKKDPALTEFYQLARNALTDESGTMLKALKDKYNLKQEIRSLYGASGSTGPGKKAT